MKSNLMWFRLVLFGLMVATALLSGCTALPSANAPTATPFFTPDIPNWGSTPSKPKYANNMPETVSCVLVPTSPPVPGGVIWRGLTVGVSTFEDVKNVLIANDDAEYWWDTISGNMRFQNSTVSTWDIVTTCFVEGKLAAMNIMRATEFVMTIPEIIAKYGNPDRVTWGRFFYERSLLWADKGLLIVIGENASLAPGTFDPVYIIFFSPVPRCQLEQSWVYQSLPKEGQPFSGDVLGAYTIPVDVEDPWKIEKGLADCPKQ